MSSVPALLALDGPSGWDRVRGLLHSLEEQGAGSPFLNLAWQEGLARLESPPRRSWFLAGPDPADPAGALILAEGAERGRGPKALRTRDYNVMRMPPAWMLPGREEEFAEFLLERLPEAGRRSGCALVRLHKLDGRATAPLRAALERRGRPCRWRVFREGPRILLGADAAAWKAKRRRKTRYNLERSRRLLQEEHPGLRFRHFLEPEAAAQAWAKHRERILALFRSVWEERRRRNGDALDAARLGAFWSAVLEDHAHRGVLAWSLLEAEPGGPLLAAQTGVREGGVFWLVLMGFDAACSRFSPGRLLLWDSLDALAGAGIGTLELGGEGLHWKQAWAGDQEPSWSLEWALGGAAGRLWEWRERWRRRRAA